MNVVSDKQARGPTQAGVKASSGTRWPGFRADSVPTSYIFLHVFLTSVPQLPHPENKDGYSSTYATVEGLGQKSTGQGLACSWPLVNV